MKGNMITNKNGRVLVIVLIVVLVCTVVGYATLGEYINNLGAANGNNSVPILESQVIQDGNVPLGEQIEGLASEDTVAANRNGNANINAGMNSDSGNDDGNNVENEVSPTENQSPVIGGETENNIVPENDADNTIGDNASGRSGKSRGSNGANVIVPVVPATTTTESATTATAPATTTTESVTTAPATTTTAPATTAPAPAAPTTAPAITTTESATTTTAPATTTTTATTAPTTSEPAVAPTLTESAEWIGTGLNTSTTVQNYFHNIGSSVGSMLDSEGPNGSVVRDELKTELGIDAVTFKIVRTSSENKYMLYVAEQDISGSAKGTTVENVKVYSIEADGEISFVKEVTGWVNEKRTGGKTFNVLNIVDSSKYPHHTLLEWLADSLNDEDSIPRYYFSTRSNSDMDSCGGNFGRPTENVMELYGIDIDENVVWKIHKSTGSNYDIYIYDGSEGDIQSMADGTTVGGITCYNPVTDETKHGYMTLEKANSRADVKLEFGTFVEDLAPLPMMSLMVAAPMELREEDIELPKAAASDGNEIDTTDEATPGTEAAPETSTDEETPGTTAAPETSTDEAAPGIPAAPETSTDEATPETPAAPETSTDEAIPGTTADSETSTDEATQGTPAAPETSTDEATPGTEAAPETSTDEAIPETPAAPETSTDEATPETPVDTDNSEADE